MTSFHDPSRPQIAGRPCFFQGRILPGLTIIPKTEELCILYVNLPVDTNSFAQKQMEIVTLELPWIMRKYAQDPENLLLSLFQWAPEQKTTKITLADLGLLK
jgi:hypothetical protein